MRVRPIVAGTVLPIALLMAAAWAQAARPKAGEFNPDHDTVEFFSAMEDGTIDVTFIAKDDKGANVLIENKTKQPLNVRLPDAFAGVPVLAQFGGGGGLGGGGGGGGGGQGMGGGMGGMGGMGGGGGGQGVFNVAPEKVGKLEVPCVCLDHGKPDPTPRMKYKIVPVHEYVKNPETIELLKLFGQGKLPHEAAQAATWHLNNDMSWQELAAKKIRSRRFPTGEKSYFHRQALQAAVRIAAIAKHRAEESSSEEKSDSLSQQ